MASDFGVFCCDFNLILILIFRQRIYAYLDLGVFNIFYAIQLYLLNYKENTFCLLFMCSFWLPGPIIRGTKAF